MQWNRNPLREVAKVVVPKVSLRVLGHRRRYLDAFLRLEHQILTHFWNTLHGSTI